MRIPPGVAGDQVCLQDRPQLRNVQAPDRVLLSSPDVGRIEFVHREGSVRRPPRAGVVGGEHLNAEVFLGWHVELGRAVGAPIDGLLARPVLEVRARAVWAPVSDLAARCGLDTIDPSSAEDDAIVADNREVPWRYVAAIRDGRVPDVADAQLVWIGRRAMGRSGQAQQAPGAERRHVH